MTQTIIALMVVFAAVCFGISLGGEMTKEIPRTWLIVGNVFGVIANAALLLAFVHK